MDRLPDSVYSVTSVREIDRMAIEERGISGYTLMTRAGRAAVDAIQERYPDARRWQLVCGAGNNAGDGYVVARLASQTGIDMSVVAVSDPQKLSGDAGRAYRDFVAGGGVAQPWAGELDPAAEIIVDALLGSGLQRDVEGDYGAAVDAINDHAARVIAIDIPTGLHGDSGEIMGRAVRADLTVTFVGLKTGLYLAAGPDCAGDIVFSGLGIDDACRQHVDTELRRIPGKHVRRRLPRRSRAAHKGNFGHVLVVGGGPGMPGAPRLCGEAALRAGAGLVSIATHPSHAALCVATRPELMPHGIESGHDLDRLLERATVIAFGPGLGRSDWARTLVERLAGDDRPAVWDADALNWLAEMPARSPRRIITPHPGEAGTLLGKDAAAVQADRRHAVSELVARYGGAAVLKGAATLVSSGDSVPWLCTAGNPGMASAGMGDVLTGVIAGLLAQGLEIEEAAVLGVEVHALAGDAAAAAGERGLIASDLLAEFRGIINP